MKISAKRIACYTRISNIHNYTVSSISRFYDTTYYNLKRSKTFEMSLYDVLWVNISNLNALWKLHRSSSNSSSAGITRAYTLQPKSLKSITTRHDGTKRNTRNTTQNAIHANRDACKIDHDTSRFRWFCCSFGSVGFRWVPLDSVVPLGSVFPLGSVGFRCFC